MSKEIIRFRGLSFNRDEQSAAHGELSLCAGVELHDGTLRPSVLDGSKIENTLDSTLKYVHETPSYRHFIGVDGYSLYWYAEDGTKGSNTAIHTFTNETIIKVESVGNTLLVMTESGVHYILWKEGGYKYLGNQIPFLPIQFRPTEQNKGKYDRSTVENNNYENEVSDAWRKLDQTASEIFHPSDSTGTAGISSGAQSAITEGVHAIINQANNTIAKDGHFYAPFLIRYCYRLYDGSMVMHSAPVFMNVAHPRNFKVYCANVDRRIKINGQEVEHPTIRVSDGPFHITVYTDGTTTYDFTVDRTVLMYKPNNVGIEYYISDSSFSTSYSPSLDELREDWADIVKSVDFFVSAPIVREDMGELIKQMIVEPDTCGVRASYLQKFMATLGSSGEDRYRWWVINTYDYLNDMIFDIPMLTDEAYLQKILNTSNFYKIASYKLDDLRPGYYGGGTKFQTLQYDKSVIPNITVQEEMKDDYHTHNLLLPIDENSGMYVYNHRLNLYGMKEQLFEGFPLASMFNYYSIDNTGFFEEDNMRNYGIDAIYVELDTDEGKKYVKTDSGFVLGGSGSYALTKSLLFYPDSRARRMILINNGVGTCVLKMEPMNFLNGAVVTDLFFKDSIIDFFTSPAITFPTVDNIVKMPNRIITSEADNPYYFPLEGRNAVGVGSVKGIAAVTRALSQGQVGDHDLVVFSTDGIWVMKVSSTGTYMSTHNISREVCSNVRSICQLDQSIVFATQRSLSKFVESDVVSISDILDGPIPNLTTLFPSLASWFETGEHADADIYSMLGFSTPAVDMFNSGRVFYDYASLRVIVLPADTSSPSVALVFSIRDQAWSTMKVPGIRAVIPGYPSPYVQTADGKVMVLNKQYGYTGIARSGGLVITRTLTFSDTMDVLRGYRQMTDSAQMPMLFFFGSNDQRNWRFIGNSEREYYDYLPGHPFRFFRIAIAMKLLPSEEYQQLQLEVINKYQKL